MMKELIERIQEQVGKDDTVTSARVIEYQGEGDCQIVVCAYTTDTADEELRISLPIEETASQN